MSVLEDLQDLILTRLDSRKNMSRNGDTWTTIFKTGGEIPLMTIDLVGEKTSLVPCFVFLVDYFPIEFSI